MTREFLRTVFGTALLCLLDHLAARLLDLLDVSFPSFVLSMMALFVGLSLMRRVHSRSLNAMVHWFTPACGFLSRWMALFFLPPLVLLPTKHAPCLRDLLLLVAIGGSGFVASFFVAGAVADRASARQGQEYERPPTLPVPRSRTVLTVGFSLLAFPSGAVAILLPRSGAQLLFGTTLSVLCFLAAEALRNALARRGLRTLSALGHPVLTSAGFIALIWQWSGFPLGEYLMPAGEGWSPGGLLTFLLRPSVVSLAFALDAQRQLIRSQAMALLLSTACSAFFSFFFTAWLAGALALGSQYDRAILPRSVTTPVALSIAESLGADGGLTAMVVILTGVLGALFAAPLGRLFRFDSPFVLGVATGASSHGIGTAGLAHETPVAAAFSGITFALTAIFSALLISHDLVRQALLSLL